MGDILVVGEVAPDGSLTKLSTEVATLARALAAAGGGSASGVVPAAGADAAAAELAGFLPSVVVDAGAAADATASERAAVLAVALDGVDHVLVPASPDGRDLAGVFEDRVQKPILGEETVDEADALGFRGGHATSSEQEVQGAPLAE